MKNNQARVNFINWYFSDGEALGTLKRELVTEGESNWVFEGLLEVASNIPEEIKSELAYADKLDEEMELNTEYTVGDLVVYEGLPYVISNIDDEGVFLSDTGLEYGFWCDFNDLK